MTKPYGLGITSINSINSHLPRPKRHFDNFWLRSPVIQNLYFALPKGPPSIVARVEIGSLGPLGPFINLGLDSLSSLAVGCEACRTRRVDESHTFHGHTRTPACVFLGFDVVWPPRIECQNHWMRSYAHQSICVCCPTPRVQFDVVDVALSFLSAALSQLLTKKAPSTCSIAV